MLTKKKEVTNLEVKMSEAMTKIQLRLAFGKNSLEADRLMATINIPKLLEICTLTDDYCSYYFATLAICNDENAEVALMTSIDSTMVNTYYSNVFRHVDAIAAKVKRELCESFNYTEVEARQLVDRSWIFKKIVIDETMMSDSARAWAIRFDMLERQRQSIAN